MVLEPRHVLGEEAHMADTEHRSNTWYEIIAEIMYSSKDSFVTWDELPYETRQAWRAFAKRHVHKLMYSALDMRYDFDEQLRPRYVSDQPSDQDAHHPLRDLPFKNVKHGEHDRLPPMKFTPLAGPGCYAYTIAQVRTRDAVGLPLQFPKWSDLPKEVQGRWNKWHSIHGDDMYRKAYIIRGVAASWFEVYMPTFNRPANEGPVSLPQLPNKTWYQRLVAWLKESI